ncbi:hypothetical protein BJX63DRAFT_264137 [Aspergillus granulosus]|uniref:Uncharacterized protein n=1 Tax=Aspergillus granulosus TaxID=176169 RepID=A0ABR4H932_9EURO
MQHIDPIPESNADSDDEICYTPSATTHTSFPEAASSPESGLPSYSSILQTPIAVPPHKDATFVIRDRETGLVIALDDGELGLHPDEKDSGNGSYIHGRGNHWKCIENDDLWLGFRNSVSREYIGHNGDIKGHWRFIAEKKHHKLWEYFCAREQHPKGGHVLLVKHDHGFRAMKAGGKDGRELVVAGKGEKGATWDFIKVR